MPAAPTPSSAPSAYASSADLTARYDARTVCELASDTTTPVTPGALATNAAVAAALSSASGMVEAAVFAGGAYTPDDMAALVDVSNATVGKAYLKKIVCDLAMGLLWMRRPDKGQLPPNYVRAEETLEEIRKGVKVFGLLAQQETGAGAEAVVEPASDVERRAGVVWEAGRLFGTRNNRLHD